MMKPLNVASVNYISIDIVPCIHVDGWWPDEAISLFNVSDDIKTFGCNLIFDHPQELYPCYFLPNFSSPMGWKEHKEKLHLKELCLDWICDRLSYGFDISFPELCKIAYALYRCASNDASESYCHLPAPDPLWERFDRKQLIASLYEIAYK